MAAADRSMRSASSALVNPRSSRARVSRAGWNRWAARWRSVGPTGRTGSPVLVIASLLLVGPWVFARHLGGHVLLGINLDGLVGGGLVGASHVRDHAVL